MLLDRYNPQRCGAGSRCGTGGICVDASNLFTCVQAGNRCWTYACAFMDNSGKPVMGAIVYTRDGLPGWLIFDPAGTKLKPGAMVLEINDAPADETYFEALSKFDGKAVGFKIKAIQDGQLLTLTEERS